MWQRTEFGRRSHPSELMGAFFRVPGDAACDMRAMASAKICLVPPRHHVLHHLTRLQIHSIERHRPIPVPEEAVLYKKRSITTTLPTIPGIPSLRVFAHMVEAYVHVNSCIGTRNHFAFPAQALVEDRQTLS
jgi:hypothetical protein